MYHDGYEHHEGEHGYDQEQTRFNFGDRIGRGSYGEAWKGVEKVNTNSYREVVLKRLFTEKGAHVRESGKREIFFGINMQYKPHVARYMDHFSHGHDR